MKSVFDVVKLDTLFKFH